MLSKLTLTQQRELIAAFNNHTRFCRESLRLHERSGSLVPFESWPSQKKLAAAINKQQKAGQPVRGVVLKTRRSGFTLGSCSHVFKEVAFLPGRKASIISDTYKPAALEAFGYIETFRDNYVPFGLYGETMQMLPIYPGGDAMTLRWGEDGENLCEIYSAERGEIRGGGRHWQVWDEFAFWRAADLTARSAINMIPDVPDSGLIVQSTANGLGGEFYELVQRARDPHRAGGWFFLFFGWLEDENARRSFGVDDDIQKFAKSLDREENLLHTRFGATLEQLNWRRWKIETSFRGRVDDFHQEYPSTPDEAFLSSGRPALDLAAVARQPVMDGTIGELEVIEDYPRERIRFVPKQGGAVTIWRMPVPGRRYVLGADPSKGKDVSTTQRGENPDFSVGIVFDGDTGEQVAMVRGRIRPGPFADYLHVLGKFYNWAFMIPESNDAGFIDAILRSQYPTERIYQGQRDPTDLRSARLEEIGFYTDGITRPWLIQAIDEGLREGMISVHCAITVQEMRTFVIKPNGKAEHQDNCHDDCVIACALGAIGLRSQPRARVLTERQKVSSYGRNPGRDEDYEPGSRKTSW